MAKEGNLLFGGALKRSHALLGFPRRSVALSLAVGALLNLNNSTD